MPHTLLLADDSVTIRRVIELTFADESVRVVSVSSGREAIASIEASPPDIILADAGMPDVSGYDIAAFVKGRPHLRHIPVILLAGAFEPLDEARSRKAGGDGVLVKPFEPQMVVARVRELLSPPGTALHAAQPAGQAPAAKAPAPIDPNFDASLDATSATDFANDLRELRSGKNDSGGFERQDFGNWDLQPRTPNVPSRLDAVSAHDPEAVADVLAAPEPEPVVPPLPSPIALAPKPAPVAPPSAPHVPLLPAPRPAAALPLADAFTNLLAAEEGRPHAPLGGAVVAAAPPHAALTEADMDVIVDRVLSRLGPDVRGAVIDLAERLVKAEIDRLKALR